ncbi:polysaccharide pyruvyl transferase family protein [Pontibacter diazotrophicus]|uniref:Polysaccharide pyruvyl transferase family protein n=1 Tax=Pontibacter diazotrophicus TaxID=1400979 RepID=A0A3D8LFE2_9BACT|nr:polysaccharide pyruvyl transferase family protein [Pontibacter diazotrophicus]RDV16130.1 polysaccharide pyruvyl transferase family protein [Pontibacter diazotrophicus]
MKIQIDGTERKNKGAELMLYAILGEVENRFPNSTVYYNNSEGSIETIDTTLDLRHRFLLKHGRYPRAIFRRLKMDIPIFDRYYADPQINIVLDASGFRWGDQWKYKDEYFQRFRNYYQGLKSNGTKIILLPQAFGPFQTTHGKKIIDILNDYADLVVAREEISYNYLVDAGLDKDKTMICTDFSLTVKGEVPQDFKVVNGICVIPNSQMINHTATSSDQYISFLHKIIQKSRSLGYTPFLLNHEGKRDLKLCHAVNQSLDSPVQIFSDLDSKQLKGVISASFAVISSRYHGVASALNQNIPCLATSWSHKYSELFKDFGLEDRVVKVTESEKILESRLNELLDTESNRKMRNHLIERKPELSNQVGTMWEKVFSLL